MDKVVQITTNLWQRLPIWNPSCPWSIEQVWGALWECLDCLEVFLGLSGGCLRAVLDCLGVYKGCPGQWQTLSEQWVVFWCSGALVTLWVQLCLQMNMCTFFRGPGNFVGAVATKSKKHTLWRVCPKKCRRRKSWIHCWSILSDRGCWKALSSYYWVISANQMHLYTILKIAKCWD